MACGTVRAEVHYLKRLALYQREKPFQVFIPIDKDARDPRQTNLEFEPKEQTFVDIRDRVHDFSLDSHGFQFMRAPTALASFAHRDQVESKYFSEVEEILKGIDGGYDRVFLFDWRLRSAGTPKEGQTLIDMNNPTTWLRPSPNVHVEPAGSAPSSPTASAIRGGFSAPSVWRPIEGKVEDYPLACCDPNSVLDEDLVECDHVRKRFKGANLYAHFDDRHKWYYLGEQQPDEVLLMKMFDSDHTVKATTRSLGCPHASFHHPMSIAGSRPRKSIEVRALLFNYPH